ncbi:MAG: alcohol dehydrogenase catalytic domain-containing protein [Burkholderiales bacterium]
MNIQWQLIDQPGIHVSSNTSSISSMSAILFDQPGDATEVLRWGKAPLPSPSAEQVRISVSVRVIQPADLLFVAGRYRVKPEYPQVAGFDGAGVVDAVGPGVDAKWVGRRVAFRSPGAWADHAVAPVSRVYAVPDDIDDEFACQFPLNPLTAWGLLDMASLAPGAHVLATAGESMMSRFLTALAIAQGISLTLVARTGSGTSASGYRVWKATGADAAEATGDTLASVLQAAAPAGGFQAVLDAVGGPATIDLFSVAATGATVLSYGVLDDRPFEIKASTLVYRNLRWQGFGIDDYLKKLTPQQVAASSETLWQLVRSQPSLLAPARSYPIADFAIAIAGLKQTAKEGRTLLTSY